MESHQNLLDTSGDPVLILSNRCSNILTYLLLHRTDSFLRNYLVFSYSRNYRHFMQPEGSLPHSQVPATCPYPEPGGNGPYSTFHFLKIYLPLKYHLCLGLASGLLISGFPTKTLYTPLLSTTHATCLAHHIFLHIITRTIFGEQYRS